MNSDGRETQTACVVTKRSGGRSPDPARAAQEKIPLDIEDKDERLS